MEKPVDFGRVFVDKKYNSGWILWNYSFVWISGFAGEICSIHIYGVVMHVDGRVIHGASTSYTGDIHMWG